MPFGPITDDPAVDEPVDEEVEEDDWESRPLQLAIVGRPNVGKSTIVNKLLGEDRVLTGPEAGITRDSISISWAFNDRAIRLIDTAGLRRKARVKKKLEGLSVGDTLNAIRFAEVVVLVLDGTLGLEKQDLSIARLVIEEGRALIIAVNKWDAVEDRSEALEGIKHKLGYALSQTKDIEFATISAIRGKNIDKLFFKALKTYETWNKRIGTGGLNRWIARMESQNPAPLVNGRHNRLKYITQIKTRPPTFALWVSRPKELPDSYKRYIINGLRRDFDIPSVPIRLLVRASKNPYA